MAHAAVLLAVALLNAASVRSIVMQAQDSAPDMAMSLCTGMGPAMAPKDAGHSVPHGKTRQTCPFCAIAAHPPLCGAAVVIPQSSAVAWTAYEAQVGLGPRGPPDVTPKARGPPTVSLMT